MANLTDAFSIVPLEVRVCVRAPSFSLLNHFFFSCALCQEGFCAEPYRLLLEPWVHYIPADYRLSTLSASVDWAVRRPGDAATIAGNAARFAKAFLTQRSMETYFEKLVVGYAGLINDPPNSLKVF